MTAIITTTILVIRSCIGNYVDNACFYLLNIQQQSVCLGSIEERYISSVRLVCDDLELYCFHIEPPEMELFLAVYDDIHQTGVIARNNIGCNLCLVTCFTLFAAFHDKKRIKKLLHYFYQYVNRPTDIHEYYVQPENECEEILSNWEECLL
ncbi:hypothetical protein [Photorhabdus sp. RM323S]|uniref:hypothetical protein n=1 Tax=Photorhabdus sp. RM323S TaxID=3342828 RepID=UPI0036DDF9AA